MDPLVERHYRALAERYDELLRWSPDFVPTHARRMVDRLELEADDLLVDLGCGPGIYARAILEIRPLTQPVIGVDPFAEMLAEIPDDVPITPVQADAVTFSSRPGRYDKVLMKEAVHHVDRKRELFENLHERLTEGGILLLVNVDPHLVEYPLFDAALERCRTRFADPDEMVRLLGEAGFEVAREVLAYHHRVPTERYVEMVENRYMSVLTSFDDDELRAGIEQMRARYGDRAVLEFPESFDYLTARPAASAEAPPRGGTAAGG